MVKINVLKYPKTDMIVCWLKYKRDLAILLNEGWYRIPVTTELSELYKVTYLSFYQPTVFGNLKFQTQYYGKVSNITVVKRKKLFPFEKPNFKSNLDYYKIELSDLDKLKDPIISKRNRKVIFVDTTIEKFLTAKELNDLFHGSPLEDKLWAEFKKKKIDSERQYTFGAYKLDFASFCKRGRLNVECDGDSYHANKEKAKGDNIRNNYLTRKGWSILRYSTDQLNNPDECVGEIIETIKRKGGIDMPNFEESFKSKNKVKSVIDTLNFYKPSKESIDGFLLHGKNN